MNREERRHPQKQPKAKPPPGQEIHGADKPQEEASVRAKSSRHKKSTADKWNQ